MAKTTAGGGADYTGSRSGGDSNGTIDERVSSKGFELSKQRELQLANYRAQLVKKGITDEAKLREKLDAERKRAEKADIQEIEKYRKQLELEAAKEHSKLLMQGAESFGDKLKGFGEAFSASIKEAGAKLKENAGQAINQTMSNMTSSVDSYMNIYSRYMGRVDARLQGSTKSFDKMVDLIGNNLSFSPLVSQKAVIENLATLVQEGINYNVEQRAFLMTVKDKIAETFNVANGTLLQLIRIQQADSTAARMGISASLTRYLNATFQDTSYLNNYYQTVSDALLGASSQLGREQGVEFEYVVQKWLGSLGSVGVSGGTLTTLAQGLNALATGDIGMLSGNESLMSLLAMASSRSGLSLGSILTGGLTSSDANRLLRGIVEYAQEIGATDNKVVKSSYASLFGFDISDFTAILNLTSKDLDSISKNMYSYAQAVQETENQLSALSSRTHISEMVENLMENVLLGAGMDIAGSPAAYMTWKAASLIKNATGGINIPVGFTSIELMNTLQTGMIGMATLGNLIGALGNLYNGYTGTSLNAWGASDMIIRGTGLQGIKGASRGKSTTITIGSGDTSDLIESAKSNQQITSDEETDLTKILHILSDWNFNGYVKSVSVDATSSELDTVDSTKIKTRKNLATIDEDSTVGKIFELLSECISGGYMKVRVDSTSSSSIL